MKIVYLKHVFTVNKQHLSFDQHFLLTRMTSIYDLLFTVSVEFSLLDQCQNLLYSFLTTKHVLLFEFKDSVILIIQASILKNSIAKIAMYSFQAIFLFKTPKTTFIRILADILKSQSITEAWDCW